MVWGWREPRRRAAFGANARVPEPIPTGSWRTCATSAASAPARHANFHANTCSACCGSTRRRSCPSHPPTRRPGSVIGSGDGAQAAARQRRRAPMHRPPPRTRAWRSLPNRRRLRIRKRRRGARLPWRSDPRIPSARYRMRSTRSSNGSATNCGWACPPSSTMPPRGAGASRRDWSTARRRRWPDGSTSCRAASSPCRPATVRAARSLSSASSCCSRAPFAPRRARLIRGVP